MKKIGALITTHNNPQFLRFVFLQVMAQTLKPHVIVVHENNHTPEYHWAVADLIAQAASQNIEVILRYNANLPNSMDWYRVAQEALFDAGCDYFLRFDSDDFYFDNHIATMVSVLRNGYDFVVYRKAGILKLHKKTTYEYTPLADFSNIHAPEGMSGSMAFSRRFCEQSNADLVTYRAEALWDDQVIARYTMPKFAETIYRIDTPAPTVCYVVHGANVSSAHWVQD